MDKKCPFFQKTENTFEKRQLFDVSLYSKSWRICRCLFYICLYFMLSYIVQNIYMIKLFYKKILSIKFEKTIKITILTPDGSCV